MQSFVAVPKIRNLNMKLKLILLLTLTLPFLSFSQTGWQQISTPASPTMTWYDINCLSDSVLVVVGNDFNPFSAWTMTSTDAGNSWKLDSFPSRFFLAGAFFDANHIAVVGSEGGFSTFASSTDGGATWAVTPDGSTRGMNDISVVSPTVGFAAGSGINSSTTGSIYKTTDAGVNWTKVSEDTLFFTEISFFSATEGSAIAIGPSGDYHLVRTTDGGANFSVVMTSTVDFTGIDFFSANLGFVAESSASNFVAKTSTDGGATWNTGGTLPGYVRRISARNATNIYAVGPSSLIVSSTDAGASWTTETASTTAGFFNASFGSRLGFIAGSNNAIFRKEFFSATSLPNAMNDLQISLSPNPCTDRFAVRLEGEIPAEVTTEILNIEGKVVWKEKNRTTQGTLEVPTTDWMPGIYLVRLSSKGSVLGTGKIIKQ